MNVFLILFKLFTLINKSIYNNQDAETTQMSINREMDKDRVDFLVRSLDFPLKAVGEILGFQISVRTRAASQKENRVVGED